MPPAGWCSACRARPTLMKKFKVLNVVGYSWVILAGLYIFYRYFVVLMSSKAPFVSRLLSFMNIWNVFFGLAVLMPGLICILLSDKLKKIEKQMNKFGAGPR